MWSAGGGDGLFLGSCPYTLFHVALKLCSCYLLIKTMWLTPPSADIQKNKKQKKNSDASCMRQGVLDPWCFLQLKCISYFSSSAACVIAINWCNGCLMKRVSFPVKLKAKTEVCLSMLWDHESDHHLRSEH